MSKSSKSKNPDHITIDEAASILGCGIDKVREYANQGDLMRLRASNGELRFSRRDVKQREYIIRCVAEAPPISDAGIDLIAVLLRPRSVGSGHVEPSENELRRRKEAEERAEALKELKRKAMALTACHGCGLQPEEHRYQGGFGMGFHEWEPIRG